jgi:hypothetical protein
VARGVVVGGVGRVVGAGGVTRWGVGVGVGRVVDGGVGRVVGGVGLVVGGVGVTLWGVGCVPGF